MSAHPETRLGQRSKWHMSLMLTGLTLILMTSNPTPRAGPAGRTAARQPAPAPARRCRGWRRLVYKYCNSHEACSKGQGDPTGTSICMLDVPGWRSWEHTAQEKVDERAGCRYGTSREELSGPRGRTISPTKAVGSSSMSGLKPGEWHSFDTVLKQGLISARFLGYNRVTKRTFCQSI